MKLLELCHEGREPGMRRRRVDVMLCGLAAAWMLLVLTCENGYGQLVIELGIVGLLLWIALAYAVTRSAWQAAKKLKGTEWFPIGFAIFWFTFLLVFPMSYYGFVTYQDFVLNSYFWLMLGILFRLSEFPKNLPVAQTTT